MLKNNVVKEGSKINVLLEKLEHPKTGEIVVSAEKAIKLEGWKKMKADEYKNEPKLPPKVIYLNADIL